MNTRRTMGCLGAALLLNGLSLTAFGQEAVVEAIIVTARAREEMLQDVPTPPACSGTSATR